MSDKIKNDKTGDISKAMNMTKAGNAGNIKSILELDAAKIGLETVCYSCGTRFYDLGKADPTCPSCDTQYSKSMRVVKKAHVAAEFFADDDLDVLADDDTDTDADDIEEFDDSDE